jgi:3-oxoacyl-[acyl-carrier protein] reductase
MRLDRVAIVTGGSRGIGREVGRNLAGRGYAVIVNYARNQRDADAAVEEILAANGTALTVRADVADDLDVERLFTETTEAFGGVDVVVHAAAGREILGPASDHDLDAFDALLRTNVRGTFVVNQLAARQLRDGGAIVNISSSIVDPPHAGYAAHPATKTATEAITPALARELRGRTHGPQFARLPRRGGGWPGGASGPARFFCPLGQRWSKSTFS